MEIVLFSANNVPYILGPRIQQWTVLQANVMNLTMIDIDSDTVTLFPLFDLPSNSHLHRIPGSNIWQFSWTPLNTNAVQLVYVYCRMIRPL